MVTVGGDDSRELREQRSVEISAALFVGALVGVAVVAGMLGFGWWAAPPQEFWDPIARSSRPLGFGLGVAVALWWLVRARRRGV